MNEDMGDRWHPATEENDTETFSEMIAGLSPAMQHIFRLRFEEDMTLEEIGKNIGRSNEWVRQLINKQLATMEA